MFKVKTKKKYEKSNFICIKIMWLIIKFSLVFVKMIDTRFDKSFKYIRNSF